MPYRDLGNGETVGIRGVVDVSTFVLETTAVLGAGATFTGPFRDTLIFNWAAAHAFASHAGTLFLDEAEDSAGANGVYQVATQATAATPATHGTPGLTTGNTARIVPQKNVLRYVRNVYVNGATLQTAFRLNTALSPLN